MLAAQKLASLLKAAVSAQGSHADQEGRGQQKGTAVTQELVAEAHQWRPQETPQALQPLQAAQGGTLAATAEPP